MRTTKPLRHNNNHLERRTVLAGLLALPALGACAPAGSAKTGAAGTGGAPSNLGNPGRSGEFARLERQYGARLGVFAVNTATGRALANREHERFAMCSTFKPYAAASLLRTHQLDSGFFAQRIHYTREDLVEYSPVTESHVDTGMTVSELCDAAITMSDNTAGNLLLRLQGGPSAIAPFARSIGDTATGLDRWETALNSALPGDERDTTTPSAIATGYRALVVDNALGAPERDQLTAWLLANTTGGDRIRAGVPATWRTGGKTGTGDYGTNNHVAVTWTDRDQPIVIAALSAMVTEDPEAERDDALLAGAARTVAEALG